MEMMIDAIPEEESKSVELVEKETEKLPIDDSSVRSLEKPDSFDVSGSSEIGDVAPAENKTTTTNKKGKWRIMPQKPKISPVKQVSVFVISFIIKSLFSGGTG
jgi:hypothetical protein